MANPPFSDKRWSTGIDPADDPHDRFRLGVPPGKQGDYAYLLHIVRSLKNAGKGACILPHGVLFRGNAEADIRKKLIRKGYIKGIIGLPANLFYGTGIPACIIVIDKAGASVRKGIFMVDASKGFKKDGPKNRLRDMDIQRIVDVFTKQVHQPGYAKMVSFNEIEKNEFNLNLPRYIDSQDVEDIQDIDGHLQGGIPVADVNALSRYWSVCPKLRSRLFRKLRKGYVQLAIEKSHINQAIGEHPEFVAFVEEMESLFDKWRKRTAKKLKALEPGLNPKSLIADLGIGLLKHYEGQALVSNYDVYQHLMDYWSETMQDDCYLIAADGWKVKTARILVKNKKGKEQDKGWTCDLVPKELIISRYFAEDQTKIDKFQTQLESITSQLAELEEEHGGEEGAFAELDKVNKAGVTARLKEIKNDKEAKDEAAALNKWIKLNQEQAATKKAIKEAEAALDAKAYAKYPTLTETEIKSLVVDNKWMKSLGAAIGGEVNRISQALTRRVKELAERYETPLPEIDGNVKSLEKRVRGHLKKMGLA